MDDNEATHEVDATEKHIRDGYAEESQEEVMHPAYKELFDEDENTRRDRGDFRERLLDYMVQHAGQGASTRQGWRQQAKRRIGCRRRV